MSLSHETDLSPRVIGLAIEVHRHLGPGLLESAYEESLCFELNQAEIGYRRQVSLPIVYKDVRLDCGYRIDLIIENQLVLEIKGGRANPPHPRSTTAHLPSPLTSEVGIVDEFQ